ncbi:MAG: dimethylargininase [Gemmatimonadetes bacterium]|nr:MAG: dimethylargininase [Gemmatimonadota bacterium]
MRAVVRTPGASLARCLLTHRVRDTIDVARACAQHRAYVETLESLGCSVACLPPADDLPDAVFVEDTVVVLPEVAVVTRPGHPSRRPEVEAVASVLAPHRRLVRMQAPATLDGGDVLRVGRDLFVGRSTRTNDEGVRTLAATVEPLGYRVRDVELRDALHLKTAATAPSEGCLLLNPDWVDQRDFPGIECLEVDPAEPFGGCVLPLAGRVLVPASAPRTGAVLSRAGYATQALDISEFEKAEAGLTCLSVLF